MPYIVPEQVISPKLHWKLIVVLEDRGPGEVAYAVGEWDGKPRIGFRWNGTDNNPIGNPQSRGLPTWTMVDEELHLAIVQRLPEAKQAIACAILRLEVPPMVELKVSRHPLGNRTLMKRMSGQRMFEDCDGDLRANSDDGTFYKALSLELVENLKRGTRLLIGDLEGASG